MSFRIYRLAEKRGVEKRFGKGLCVNNYCTDDTAGVYQVVYRLYRTRTAAPPKKNRSREKRRNSRRASLSAGLSFSNLSAICSASPRWAENGVEKGDGSAVMHETRVAGERPKSGAVRILFVRYWLNSVMERFLQVMRYMFLAVVLGHGLDDTVADTDGRGGGKSHHRDETAWPPRADQWSGGPTIDAWFPPGRWSGSEHGRYRSQLCRIIQLRGAHWRSAPIARRGGRFGSAPRSERNGLCQQGRPGRACRWVRRRYCRDW